MVRIFDIQNGKVIPSEHCYIVTTLKNIMAQYPEDYMSIYAYIYYMTCPDPDNNPFFDLPSGEKESVIYKEVNGEFSLEDEPIIAALDLCRKLYETPTVRAYNGMKSMLDRLAYYLETTPISHGRDGNINSLLAAGAKFESIRMSFKGTLKDLMEEQKGTVRGGQRLSYDQTA